MLINLSRSFQLPAVSLNLIEERTVKWLYLQTRIASLYQPNIILTSCRQDIPMFKYINEVRKRMRWHSHKKSWQAPGILF